MCRLGETHTLGYAICHMLFLFCNLLSRTIDMEADLAGPMVNVLAIHPWFYVDHNFGLVIFSYLCLLLCLHPCRLLLVIWRAHLCHDPVNIPYPCDSLVPFDEPWPVQ